MANASFDHLYPIDVKALERWISENSEGILHDFKQELDVTDNKKKCEFIRDMIGLSNMAWIEKTCSYLIIGVANEGEVVGINEKFQDEATYQEIIRSSVTPKVDFSVREIPIQGKTLAIFVIRNSSSDTPHVVKKPIYSDHNRQELQEGQSWLRHGSGKYKATTHELLELVARHREKTIPSDIAISIENDIALDFLNYQETSIDTNIYSLSTRAEVPYIPLRIEIQDTTDPNQKKVYDAVEWWRQSDRNVLILGQPGQGKTSLLKQLFIKNISDFRKKKEAKLPIFVKSANFRSYDDGMEWLCQKNDPTQEFYKLIEEGVISGRLLIFVDAWDELTPSRRIEIEKFLIDVIRKNNRITITSRSLPDIELPKLAKNEREEPKKDILSKIIIKPLEKEQIPIFLASRTKGWSQTKIKNFLSVFSKSSLENIPLWLDLLSSPIELQDDGELTEILILGNWVNQVINRDQGQIIAENIVQVEKLAYHHVKDWEKETLTQYYIQDISKIPVSIFSALKRVGWLITSSFEQTEPTFEFVHHRLEEYLAARYICRNWNELAEELFDRRSGVLCQPNKEVIIELAVSEAIRRKYKEDEILKRIYQITGENGWDYYTNDGKPYQAEILRDPFLSGYLLEIWALQPKLISWHTSIDQFLVDVFEQYDKESPYGGWRYWIDRNHMIRGVLARIPEQLFRSKDRFHMVESAIVEVKLTDAIIDKNLELLNSIEVLEHPKYTKRFLNLLGRRSTPGKWQEVIIEYAKHEIQKTPCSFYVVFLLDKVEETNRVERLYLSWANNKNPIVRANCLEMFPPILKKKKVAQEIIDKLIEDEKHEVQQLAASMLNSHPEFLTKNNLKSWLKSPYLDVRKLALSQLINPKVKDLIYSLESELSDLLTDDEDLESLIHNYIFNFTKSEWNFLLAWFCKNKPLSQLIFKTRNLYRRKDFNILLQKIPLYIEKPIDRVEATRTLEVLPFDSDVALSFAKTYLLKASKELKLYIEKYQIYKDLSRGTNFHDDKLNNIFAKDPEFFDELKYCLEEEAEINDEIISTTIEVLQKLEKPPIQLLNWVVQNPLWLTPEWLNELISLEIENSVNTLFHYLLQFRNILVSKGKMYEIASYLLDLAVNDKNRDFITVGALCCEFLPLDERNNLFDIIQKHSLANIRAIYLRMLAEDFGINLKRVMQKAKICIESKLGRPVYQHSNVLDKKGHIGIMEISNRRRKKKGKVNFGLVDNEELLDIKDIHHKIHPISVLVPMVLEQESIILEWKDFSSKSASYDSVLNRWRIPLSTSSQEVYLFGNHQKEQSLSNGLLDSSDSIVLATLFYLEDILIFSNELFGKKGVKFPTNTLKALHQLETSSNSLIKGMASVISLSASTEKERVNYIQNKGFYIHTLQAFLWVCGGDTNKELDNALTNYLKKMSPEDLIQSLPIMVPWIIAFPQSYKETWRQFVTLDKEVLDNSFFDGLIPNFVFYFFYRTLLLFNKINATYLAKNGRPMIYPLVDNIFKSIQHPKTWDASEIEKLSTTLVSHQHEAFNILGRTIRISLGYDSISLKEMDISKLSKSETVFLKIYYHELSLLDKKECCHRLLQIGDVHDKIWVVKQLQTFPVTTDLLTFLHMLINMPKEEFEQILWLSDNEIMKLWESAIPVLIEKHFDVIVEDYPSLLVAFPLNFLPRTILEKLLDWYNNKEGEIPQIIVNRTFQLLYPKLWYSYNKFWEEVVLDE